MRRMATSCAAKAAGSARGARSPKKFRVPASKAAVRRSRNMRLNSRKGDRGDVGRQRETDMEIGARKRVRFSRGEPLGAGLSLTLRAMSIPAGIIGDPGHAAGVASLHVTAERLGSARNDRTHHAPLNPTEMTGMQTAIGVAMPAQDIGNLDGGSVGTDVRAAHNPHPRRVVMPVASPPATGGRAGSASPESYG